MTADLLAEIRNATKGTPVCIYGVIKVSFYLKVIAKMSQGSAT